jgi:hypothetical protein
LNHRILPGASGLVKPEPLLDFLRTEPAPKKEQTNFGFFEEISSNPKKHREKSGSSPRLTKTRRIIGELL